MIANIPLQTQVEQLINTVTDKCPVCGSGHLSPMETVYWRSVKISYSICNFCSLIFQNPYMDSANTALFYERYYRLFNDGIEAPTPQQLKYQKGRTDYFEKRLKPFIAASGKERNFLDIGSSGGTMLEMIKAGYPGQFNINGIEPGNAYREFSIANGFTVYDSLSSLVEQSKRKFDLVTMSHVLEHLSDPVGYLSEIKANVIAGNGLMMIEVPNYFGHYSYELSHNFCFTKKTLTDVIRLAGFETVSLITHARPNVTFKPLYLNIIIKPSGKKAQAAKSPAWLIKVKRRLAPTDNNKLTSRVLNYAKRLLVKMKIKN